MTSKEIQKKAKQFKRKYAFYDCNFTALKKVTEEQGYIIVEFNHILNDDSVKTLIDSLGLQEYISTSKGFTYVDKNHRIVFIHEDLNPEEKAKVLAHENGHIFLNHFSSSQVIGKDGQEEYEANEFAHYLQTNSVSANFNKHKKIYVAIIAVVLVTAISFCILAYINKEKQYYGEYYITQTGNKYHERECIFVKDKTSTHRLTVEQFNSGEYEACAMCLPD